MGSIKKIFLTGATGYLGSHLLNKLVATGYEVTVLKRNTSSLHRIAGVLEQVSLLNAESINIDTHFGENKYDAIIHTAASYGRGGDTLNTVLTPNLYLPLQILNAAIASNVRYFINTDTALPKDINSYALSKKQFAEWLQFFKNKIKIINVELQYFFGPGDDEWKFVNSIIRKFLAHAPSIDFTTAEQIRDFIYIDDAIAAYMLLLEKAEMLSSFSQVELGSGKAVKLKDLILTLQNLCNAADTKLNFGAIPIRANEVMYSEATNTLLDSYGWKPVYTLEEGLIKTIEIEKHSHVNT